MWAAHNEECPGQSQGPVQSAPDLYWWYDQQPSRPYRGWWAEGLELYVLQSTAQFLVFQTIKVIFSYKLNRFSIFLNFLDFFLFPENYPQMIRISQNSGNFLQSGNIALKPGDIVQMKPTTGQQNIWRETVVVQATSEPRSYMVKTADGAVYRVLSTPTAEPATVEPLYNEVLGTMKITLLYQVSHYIRVQKQRKIKSWDQQNDLVIRGFCYIWPRYNEVPLYICLPQMRYSGGSTTSPPAGRSTATSRRKTACNHQIWTGICASTQGSSVPSLNKMDAEIKKLARFKQSL